MNDINNRLKVIRASLPTQAYRFIYFASWHGPNKSGSTDDAKRTILLGLIQFMKGIATIDGVGHPFIIGGDFNLQVGQLINLNDQNIPKILEPNSAGMTVHHRPAVDDKKAERRTNIDYFVSGNMVGENMGDLVINNIARVNHKSMKILDHEPVLANLVIPNVPVPVIPVPDEFVDDLAQRLEETRINDTDQE